MQKLKTICFVAIAIATTGCFTSSVHAEESPRITDAIADAMFKQSGDTYRNTGIDRQATLLFGLSYPDLEAVSDARSVDNIYRDLIRQRGDTPLRTADLPNPFSSSLLSNPSSTRN
jgi:hypothetical protein